ncbi:hypothetical protein [Vibrio sp. SCSIO 43136]|uniref:hypothetical protein n=1 Tax=Vibrio sp. SCSIO 43136 TaxID=2819101 RepID=UPI002074B372|nr:hypothetical protein [Vibrio sp. SCSIO 43136]USD64510.1 hypothetical protein J4N39_10395 [Vibrio sp. SCSIO 43136]
MTYLFYFLGCLAMIGLGGVAGYNHSLGLYASDQSEARTFTIIGNICSWLIWIVPFVIYYQDIIPGWLCFVLIVSGTIGFGNGKSQLQSDAAQSENK